MLGDGKRPTRFRLFVIALAFACIALAREWFIVGASDQAVYPAFRPTFHGLFHLVLGHAILAAAAFGLLDFANHRKSKWWLVGTHLFLLALLVPSLLFLRAQTNLAVLLPILSRTFYESHFGRMGFYIALLVFTVGGIAVVLKWPIACARGIAVAMTLFLPFAGMHLVKLIWYVSISPSLPTPRTFASEGPIKQRVVVVVFDEFDYAMLGTHRAAGVLFPTFDRLEQNGLTAQKAYSPAIHTHAAIPSFFLGKRLKDFCRLPTDDMRVTAEGETQPVLWSTQKTWVSEAADRGIGMGIVGWYHPYCALMGASAKSCLSLPAPFLQSPRFSATTVGRMLASAFDPRAMEIPYHARRHQIVTKRAMEAVKRDDLSLVYLHLSVPHLPTIYDPDTHQIIADRGGDEQQQREGYLANLLLADKTLGELMAAAGSQIPTAWIITSDHSIHAWRWLPETTPESTIDRRVPFWVLLPSQPAPVKFETPFNSLLLKDLSMEMAEGKITTAAQVESYVKSHLPAPGKLLPAHPVDTCPTAGPTQGAH